MNADHVEAMRETAKHIGRVQCFMAEAMGNLMQRAIDHDKSKWGPEEWPYFAEATKNLRGITYGSEEYKAALRQIKPAIDHHQQSNSHHPEFYRALECNGCFKMFPANYDKSCDVCGYGQFTPRDSDITGMSLLDLLEMLADWRAATERHADGCILKSLEINAKRFIIPEPLRRILTNTVQELGWDRP